MPRISKVSAAAATLAAAAFTVLAPMSAEAKAQDYRDCYTGWVCLWNDENYQGGMIAYGDGASVANLGATWSDKATSIWNRTSRPVCFYEHDNYQPSSLFCLGAGNSSYNVGAAANDKITSLKAF